jgi:hypothetical protein
MLKNKIKYHFLYKTTNLINGKYYYGMHSTYKLDDGYLGSGKMLRYSIRKYGKENFNCDILEFYKSREDLVNAEVKLITEDYINDMLCMNLKKGGTGGISSKEHQEIFSIAGNLKLNELRKNDIFRINWLSKKNKFKSGSENINYNKINNYFSNKTHSDETKIKIGEKNSINQKGEKNSQFGTCWITKEENNKKIKKEEFEFYLNDGWIKGRKLG